MTLKEAYDKGRNDVMASLLWYLPAMSEEDREEIRKSYDPPKEEKLTLDLSSVPHVKGTPHISYELFDNEEKKYATFNAWADHVEGKK